MKILIDVTSSCQSARNMRYVSASTRQLFAELATRVPVTTLCWNRLGNFYQRLDSREMEYLSAVSPLQRPDKPSSCKEDLHARIPASAPATAAST